MDCPAGYKCGVATVSPVECGVGYYSTSYSVSCAICPRGYYCGSNATTDESLRNGGKIWSNRFESSGMCFNGTYCDYGMKSAPDLTRNACPAGYYCPAGTVFPLGCPSGTYNPVQGKDSLSDCISSPPGYYSIANSTHVTGECDAGYYCPSGSSSSKEIPCPPRYYRTELGAGSVSEVYCYQSNNDCL